MSQELSSIRDLARDERVSVVLARVALHTGETSHHLVTAEGHLAVTVKTHRHQVPIVALLPGGDDAGTGPWAIPALGTEVAVGFDDGDFAGDAFVLAIYGSLPQQIAENRVVIAGAQVWVTDAVGGAAVALATKADLQADVNYLKRQFDAVAGHTHAVVGGATTTTAESALVTGGGGQAPDPVGTQILKGQ